ncbi:hypothetical protein HMF8227_02276 [Saliniradius amylolyticus]|uniref:Outer membrane protein beta-barrel domain-containing protein n=1 Tax=Saliniradius amylolyticus TaxID=2183582 RepID=A0A2S2E557_9ALTE|nr:outer membrane beta-barrel protein [Saliniradius amylolyticus]AWL12729.1 hypothetical protein HMF8227_02276 [Saliniradius amylolyticus]
MELRKLLPLIALLSAIAMPVTAGWNMGAGYTNFSSDHNLVNINLKGVTFSAGYEFKQKGSNFTWMPEFRYGFGIGDDTVYTGGADVRFEADNFIAVGVRGTYHVSPEFNLFFQPSYANLEVTASVLDQSVSEDDWEFGYGGGFAFNATERASLELLYENFDETDVVSAGFRYRF